MGVLESLSVSPLPVRFPVISPSSIVETQGICNDTEVTHFAVIRDGTKLGNRVVIHPHVVTEVGVAARVVGDVD